MCVYGDNFIGKTSYNLLAVPTLNECDEVVSSSCVDVLCLIASFQAKDVQKLDKAVLKARAKLSDLKEEYIKVCDGGNYGAGI